MDVIKSHNSNHLYRCLVNLLNWLLHLDKRNIWVIDEYLSYETTMCQPCFSTLYAVFYERTKHISRL